MSKHLSGVAAKVETLVRPTVEAMGLALWDVCYEKEGSVWFLRVLVDRESEPMDTDTCENLSRAIDPLLDEADLVPQSYYLEVGSPGLGRQLIRDEHFAKKMGQQIRAVWIRPDQEGNRQITGVLSRKDGATVYLETQQGEVAVDSKKVSAFHLCDDVDLFEKSR